MRSFLIFLGVIVIIGIVWAIVPFVEKRSRDHVERVVASLNLVEDAVISSSADILRVNLFSPELKRLPDGTRWKLTGIIETQGRAGKAVHVRYAANIVLTCKPYETPECGKVETLSIEGKPLVVGGAIVAELQSVLGTPDDPLAGPGDVGAAADSVPIPAPQISAIAPAGDAAAPAEAAPVSQPATAAIEPPMPPMPPMANEPMIGEPVAAEPIQGDPQIFLIQKNLQKMGYDPGPVDGQVGPRTTSAIQSYQQRAGLSIDGQPSPTLLEHMIQTAP